MSRIQVRKDNRPVSVDICCPVYNHEAYLEQALISMLMQKTNFPFKIIIHDDASTDNSASIIREYESKYPGTIIAVFEEENLYQNGKSYFDKMQPYYTSKYVAHCEGDDYWIDEYKLQKQIDYLEKNPDCVAVYHNILPVNKNGEYDEKLRYTYKAVKEGDYTNHEFKTFDLYTQTASLVRRNYIDWMSDEQKNFYRDVKCNGDVKHFIVLGSIGRVHYLSDVMAAHRRVLEEGESWSARLNKMDKGEKLLMYEKMFSEKCRLYDYFWGGKKYLYNQLLFHRLRRWKTVLKIRKDLRKIPLYAYIVFLPYFCLRCIQFSIHRILRYLKCSHLHNA